MIGVDTYAATKQSFVGIDWMDLASGALKTAGGAFGGGGFGGGGGHDAAQAAAEKARLEEQKRQAEQRAATWKTVGLLAGLTVLVGGGVLLFRQPKTT